MELKIKCIPISICCRTHRLCAKNDGSFVQRRLLRLLILAVGRGRSECLNISASCTVESNLKSNEVRRVQKYKVKRKKASFTVRSIKVESGSFGATNLGSKQGNASMICDLRIAGVESPQECKLSDLIYFYEQDTKMQENSERHISQNNSNGTTSFATDSSTEGSQDELGVSADNSKPVDDETQQLKESIASLEEKLENKKLINQITDNDKMTKFYTGIKTWKLSPKPRKPTLPPMEQFLLVLMRLRLNLSEQDLAYRFNISQGSVSNYLRIWIDVMFVRLGSVFMVWPTPESLSNSTPTPFKMKFPRCVSIIDCFEIGIERFKHLLARCSTYSYYKGRNTIKFLISITPRGAISFISQGYGGRSTDVQITLDPKNKSNEKFFDKIREGDEILADRGWVGPLIDQEIKRRKATLITPTFLGRRSLLTRHETVFSRKVSNVRIHVERVIGKLRMTYTILKNKVL
ncbi:hypothetical protein GHT06_020519 [Daphnia sinensis]|uniref:DDE Tnp4 domain-containing protein n=1 Tax=Daphnia sinensis TaxID=1820382 RepID=A0AAD5L7V6_9CRUS|nr:hypothetical protein GHT06_020519 [Daphnia sinensis]